MKIKQAINNYVISEMIQNPETLGGLKRHEEIIGKARWGKIVSVGPGVVDFNGQLNKPDVEENQLAYHMAHGLFEIYEDQTGEHKLSICSVLDVMAIMNNLETLDIQPLGNFIEIEVLEIPATKSESGLLMARDRTLPSNLAVVKKLGKGWKTLNGQEVPFQVSVGDIITFNPLRKMVVDLSAFGVDEKKTLISHGDIMAIMEKE